jgi:general secretion pathway protein L
VRGLSPGQSPAPHYLVLHHGEADKQANLSWLRIQADGEPTAEAGEVAPSALGELAARYPQDKFCLLVPAAGVGLYHVKLPGRHDAAGLRALPWLLEEQLACAAQDVSIIPLGSSGETLWVAVVAQQQLVDWQAPFNAAGIHLDKLVPDALLLPWAEGEITALPWGDRWLLRTGLWQGAQMEANWLPLWLRAWQRTQTLPTKVCCYGPPPPEGAQWQLCPATDPMALLARSVPQAVSLLPGQKPTSKKAWRTPLIAAMAVLILLFCQQGLLWWQLSQQGDALEQQLLQQFRQRFPGQSEQRWQATVRRAVQQETTAGLATWLEQLPTLPQGVTVQQLHYHAAPARLQLRLVGERPQLQRARQLLTERFSVRSVPDGTLTLEPREAE